MSPNKLAVIIGGSGLIGSNVVANLRADGHEVVSASPKSGVDTITGQGLADALRGADVVVDVSNSPSFEDRTVLAFFETSTNNLLAAEAAAGVKHHVALSVVGTDLLAESGYFRAKIAQEALLRRGPIPFSIVRATQFFEFVKSIADFSTVDGVVRVPPMLIQPVGSADVGRVVADVAAGTPSPEIVEIAGPETFRLDELMRLALRAYKDGRDVVADPAARYSGATLQERTLVPVGNARLGTLSFSDWLRRL